jgi:hypothetical protein
MYKILLSMGRRLDENLELVSRRAAKNGNNNKFFNFKTNENFFARFAPQ